MAIAELARRIAVRHCAIAMALAVAGPLLSAQVTGVTATGPQTVTASAQGEPEFSPARRNQIYTVDPATGQLSLHIPILTIARSPRGPAIAYSLFYSPSAGYPTLTSTRQNSPQYWYGWKNNPLGPWSSGGLLIEPRSSSSYSGIGASGDQTVCYEYGPYVFQDADGAAHDLGLVHLSDTPDSIGLCPDVETDTSTQTMDGLPIRSTYSGSGDLTVQRANGETITFAPAPCPETQGWGMCPIRIEDANGNFVTIAYSGNTETWTDATGKVALVVNFNGTGAEISSIVTYDAADHPETYTFTWMTFYGSGFEMPDPNGSNCPYPGDCLVNQQVASPGGNELSSLQLPDGTEYTFAYDPTYGALAAIGLPTGGSVSFTYTATPIRDYNYYMDANGSEGIPYDTLAVATETRSDGAEWQYSYSGTPASDETTTITDPAGQKTVIEYGTTAVSSAVGGGYNLSLRAQELQRSIYGAGGALLRVTTRGDYWGLGLPGQVQTTLADAGSSPPMTGRAHGLHLDPGTWFTGLG